LLTDVVPEPGRQTDRYNALREYVDGKPIKYIEATHHVNRSDVLEMFRAALERHADGRLWGVPRLQTMVASKKAEEEGVE
jgi:hypothetical protein